MSTRTPALRAAGLSAPAAHAEHNDDRVLVDLSRGLFVVADGMGGMRHGGRSAQLVVDAVAELFDRTPEDIPAVLNALHERLIDLSTHSVGGVGTTVVCARVEPGVATVVHLGDSRAILARSGNVQRLTLDHSLAQALVANGELDPSQAATHPSRHLLTRYLGMPGSARPDIRRVALQPGDRLLLCSDGLVRALSDDEIAATLGEPTGTEASCRQLLERAARHDLDDDATVLLVDVLARQG